MAGEAADRIQIPVGLNTDDAAKIGNQMRQILEKSLSNIAVKIEKGQAPLALPSIIGKQTFISEGKEFEARSKIKLIGAPTFKEGESGEIDVSSVSQLVTSIKEVKQKINKSLSADQQRFQQFKKSLQFQPLEIKKTEIERFLNEFSNIEKSLVNLLPTEQIKKIKESLVNSTTFKPSTGKQFINELDELEKSFAGMSGDKQNEAISNFLKRFGDQNDELKSRLNKVNTALERKQFKKIEIKNIDLPIDERIKAYQKYIDQGGQFADDAKLKIQRLQTQLDRETALAKSALNADKRAFKSKLSTMPIGDRFTEIQKAIDSKLLDLEEGKALLARESKRFVDSIKGSRKQKFGEFTKRLQAMDPNLAIKELDNYINARSSAFVNDAKILRVRLRKQVQNAQAQAARDRGRNFANIALSAAGAGLGILGPAGFPLLNVGFAAMSGGPVAAGLVGLATGLGEAIRGISAFRDSTVEAARGIGLVPTGLKLAEARDKAFRAVIGTGSLAAERAALELEMEEFKKRGAEIRSFTQMFDNISNAAEARWKKLTTSKEALIPGPEDFIIPGSGIIPRELRRFGNEINRQIEKTRQFDTIEEMQSARRNFLSQLNRPTVGIETDPLQTWRRIQNSFFDTSKSLEEKEKREMTEMVMTQIEELKKNTEALKANTGKMSYGVTGTW